MVTKAVKARFQESFSPLTDFNLEVEQKRTPKQVNFRGLKIFIENPSGSTRSGVDKNGEMWSTKLPYHYGFIGDTESDADGDHIDVFLGPDPTSRKVFIVDRMEDGEFDEHKVMLGWNDLLKAEKAYVRCYDSPQSAGLGAISELDWIEFIKWLRRGDTKGPVADDLQEAVDSSAFANINQIQDCKCGGTCDDCKTKKLLEGELHLSSADSVLGAEANRQALGGYNPASWVADEDKWEKAKKAVDKGKYGDGSRYWSVVTHVYKNMGGGIK